MANKNKNKHKNTLLGLLDYPKKKKIHIGCDKWNVEMYKEVKNPRTPPTMKISMIKLCVPSFYWHKYM